MSGNKALLDTNAIGKYLCNEVFEKNFLKKFTSIGISIITKIEFLSHPHWAVKDKFLFEKFIELIEIYPVAKDNNLLILQTVSIRKKYKLKLPDALIAATAMVNNATLFSADDVFLKIYNLKFELITL
jgi:tRNA(fMet)-specific endonuclease VapC